jgi:hypothetical protein
MKSGASVVIAEGLRYWTDLENFGGDAAALRRDGYDRVVVSLVEYTCDSDEAPPDAATFGEKRFALSDAEWIAWQAMMEAAPAMLAALKAVRTMDMEDPDPVLAMVDGAIAKAEGRADG